MSALSRGQGLQEGRSIYKMAENKRNVVVDNYPWIIFRILITLLYLRYSQINRLIPQNTKQWLESEAKAQ